MTWREQLGKDNRGSRPSCVLLVDGNGKEVADRLTQLVGRQDEVIIDHSDRWMPYGKPVWKDGSWDNTPSKEAKLDDLASLLPRNIKRQQEIKEQLRCWWLAAKGRANTPNWDIASTCTIKGKPGLLLVEAKAHVSELCPKPHGADCPMAHLAPGVKSYPLPLSHCGIKQWRNLRPGRQPSEMPWSPPSPPGPGRIGCRRRKDRTDVPLWKAAPTQAHLPRHWRVIMLVMSPWSMTVSCNVTLMWSSRRRGKRTWKQMYHLTLLPLHL